MDQHESQRKYFDKEFKRYEKYELDSWQISYLDRIFSCLDIGNSHECSYLDVGVGGSGYTVIEVARRGCRSVGIDLSFEAVRKARLFAKPELKNKYDLCDFVICLGENLPFRENSFDRLSSISVLEHMPDDGGAIKEFARVTKTGGKVWITVPNSYKRMPPIFWILYYIHDRRMGHLRHYAAEHLIGVFGNLGFACRRVQYTGHWSKIFQILLSFILKKSWVSRKIWWRLENVDLKKGDHPTGLQLTLIFSKV